MTANTSCPHLERCSGCPAMGLPYPEQLARKTAGLERARGRYPELARATLVGVAPAEPALGYRTRVKWMVGERGELGLYARGEDHVVADIPGCLVVDPAIEDAARALRSLLAKEGPARRLRAIDIRLARAARERARLLLTLVSEQGALAEPEVVALAREVQRLCPAVAGVAWSETRKNAVQVLGARTKLLVGVSALPDDVGTATITATFGAFVQAHRGQAAAIERVVVDAARALGRAPRALELFSGAGAFAIALARAGATVDAVESHEPAAAELDRQRVGGVRAHAADAEAFTVAAARRGESWDLVVVDPPRRGLPPALREAIAAVRPRAAVYVSCDPETLARDLAHLARAGLATVEIRGLDMIPQTDEVEAIAILAPAPAPAPPPRDKGDKWSVVEVAAHAPAGNLALPPLAGASGLALELERGASRPTTRWSALALVKGVVHKRGSLRGRARYVRLAVASGHSLIRIEGSTPAQAASDLASIGHPVLGDKRCDPPTLRHFFDKHRLDRPFWHTDELEIEGRSPVTSPLPGDLAQVLESLGAEFPDPRQKS